LRGSGEARLASVESWRARSPTVTPTTGRRRLASWGCATPRSRRRSAGRSTGGWSRA